MKYSAAFFAIALCLVSCHSTSSTNTQTVSGTFMSGNKRVMQVRLNQPGTLSSEQIMAMDPKAVITIDGKTSTMSKLITGQSVSVTQNLDTKRVVEVDAK